MTSSCTRPPFAGKTAASPLHICIGGACCKQRFDIARLTCRLQPKQRIIMIVTILMLLCSELAVQCSGQSVQDSWTRPALNESIINGSEYDITWSTDLLAQFADYCSSCATTKLDVCVQPYAHKDFHTIIGSKCSRCYDQLLANTVIEGINIDATIKYSWNVDVSAANISQEIEDGWVIRFIPFDGNCDDENQQISSYPFFIREAAAPSIVSTTSSTSPTSSPKPSSSTSSTGNGSNTGSSSTADTTPSASPSPDPQSDLTAPTGAEEASLPVPGLSTGAKAGIGAGIGLAVILSAAALLLFFRAKSSRKHAHSWFNKQRILPEKEATSHQSYQSAQDDGSSWAAPLKRGGPSAAAAQPAHELDSGNMIAEIDGERNLIAEIDGGRRDR